MRPKEAIPRLLHETSLYWAGHWDALSTNDRVAEMQPGGNQRLDELSSAFGLAMEDAVKLKNWRQFEKKLSTYASELRFRVFENREDAAHAACNAASNALITHRYRSRNGTDWEPFENDFMAELKNPLSYEVQLQKCIKKHFRRP